MPILIVPDFVHDAINSALDKAIQDEPEAEKDREHLYSQLLTFFDAQGFVPQFTLRKNDNG